MNWTLRRATRASKKILANAEYQLRASLLHHAHSVRHYSILGSLRVNSDQTQVIYQQGSNSTYERKGSQQVSTVGLDEKRAFTLNVAISASGVLLPFQAIFKGKTKASLPSVSSLSRDEATRLGFFFEFSGTDNYWANLGTMKSFVINILVPYFTAEKERLLLDPLQECIWQLDVWSVHASLEFQTWMFNNYHWIILDYIPGGCTGLWQPCDVGIQRMLKLSVEHSQQTTIVREVYSQLQGGAGPCDILLDTRLGTLRDHVPATLVDVYHSINNPQRIQKASYSFQYYDNVVTSNIL
jgi:hypothetical protein